MLQQLYNKLLYLVDKVFHYEEALDTTKQETSSPYGAHLSSDNKPVVLRLKANLQTDEFEKGTLVNLVITEANLYSQFFEKKNTGNTEP